MFAWSSAHLDILPMHRSSFSFRKPIYPAASPRIDMMYSALYGCATQNLMLAARAVGLGAVMTTLHSPFSRRSATP